MSDANHALPEGVQARPMVLDDLPAVLEIIRQHDEDDADEAAKSYRQEGFFGEFVLDVAGTLFGVSGSRPIPGTEDAHRLSWTYLHTAHQGQGLGKALVQFVLDTLRITGGRKVFAETSDYLDPDRGDIYGPARALYQAMGFEEELRHAHYYDRDESLIVYGLRLKPPRSDSPPAVTHTGVELTGADEIPETEDAYALGWRETEAEGATPDEVRKVIRKVERWEGRVLFAGTPSNASGARRLLEDSRFHLDGRLSDYYADGIDELHFRYDLL